MAQRETSLGERQALHEAIYHCTRCQERGHTVYRVQPAWDPTRATGPTHRWGLLVGQAPGATEMREGRALVGKAGRGWRTWLLQAGFSSEEIASHVYKTSVTKCYPGEVRPGQDRKPTKEEIRLCSGFLRRQIRLVQPEVIIPTGMVAIHWFFPAVRRLGEVVGQQRTWSDGEAEYTVVCLPHASPASPWWKQEQNQPSLQAALGLLAEPLPAL